jgi:hydroxyethylthiazole kinase-like uncharacterized protein yjeF
MYELLTNDQMAEADRRAVARGVPSLTLMKDAGRAVAEEAIKMVRPGSRIAVLCGPGNNGGDGFVAAWLLRARGFDVRLWLLGAREALSGDAAVMAAKWELPVRQASPDALQSMHLVIDAMFGAGLSRALDGDAAEVVTAINDSGLPVLAVDVPSGLNGTTGTHDGPVVKATRTVTFFRKKPGHVLMPGRTLCGQVIVADIGIPNDVLAALGKTQFAQSALQVSTFENVPEMWHAHYPWPKPDGHKYTRGHAVVVSGPIHQTGAARLAARGSLRIGAGLVTVAGSAGATTVNAAHLTAMMLALCNRAEDLRDLLNDKRKNAVLVGPGAGTGEDTRGLVQAALASGAHAVLDADALTSFAGDKEVANETVQFGFTASRPIEIVTPLALFRAVGARPERPVVMTPHEGEFKRLFGNLAGSKLERARAAAVTSKAVMILKGPDTVIASPDGRAAINGNAPPWLATAGSGDVLAGFVTGLLAQGMPVFEAACAAVWLHGECANVFGIGLIAEDLPEVLPRILQNLYTSRS